MGSGRLGASRLEELGQQPDEVGQVATALSQALRGIRGVVESDRINWTEAAREQRAQEKMILAQPRLIQSAASAEHAPVGIMYAGEDLKSVSPTPLFSKR